MSTGPEVISSEEQHKLDTLNDPEGVRFVDHLWDLVQDSDQLTPVLRTSNETYNGIAVRTWWDYDETKEYDPTANISNLYFEMSDLVTSLIQSNFAQTINTRFFGTKILDNIPPILEQDNDYERRVRLTQKGFKEITGNWQQIKEAIRLTKEFPDSPNWQTIKLISTVGIHNCYARIDDYDLALFIQDKTADRVIKLWKQAFSQAVSL